MAENWPSNLPPCPMLNMSRQKQTNLAVFAPDVGPPKVTRRSTASIWIYAMAFRFTNDDLDTFNDFYENLLADGSLPFTWQGNDWMFDPKEAPKFDRMTPNTWRVSFNALRLP